MNHCLLIWQLFDFYNTYIKSSEVDDRCKGNPAIDFLVCSEF